ncbi:hypothetical protein, partial [Thermosphaera sp.]
MSARRSAPRFSQHFASVADDGLGMRVAAQHPNHFFHALLAFDAPDLGIGSFAANRFGDHPVGPAVSGDLRQVRDANHLVPFSHAGQFAADRMAGFPAQVRIDLIEHKYGHTILL